MLMPMTGMLMPMHGSLQLSSPRSEACGTTAGQSYTHACAHACVHTSWCTCIYGCMHAWQHEGEMFVLEREPSNPYDRNAIVVKNLRGAKVPPWHLAACSMQHSMQMQPTRFQPTNMQQQPTPLGNKPARCRWTVPQVSAQRGTWYSVAWCDVA